MSLSNNQNRLTWEGKKRSWGFFFFSRRKAGEMSSSGIFSPRIGPNVSLTRYLSISFLCVHFRWSPAIAAKAKVNWAKQVGFFFQLPSGQKSFRVFVFGVPKRGFDFLPFSLFRPLFFNGASTLRSPFQRSRSTNVAEIRKFFFYRFLMPGSRMRYWLMEYFAVSTEYRFRKVKLNA